MSIILRIARANDEPTEQKFSSLYDAICEELEVLNAEVAAGNKVEPIELLPNTLGVFSTEGAHLAVVSIFEDPDA